MLLLGTAVPASADTGSPSQYVDAVQRAYELIANASAAGIAVVGAVVFVLARAARGRFGRAVALAPGGPRPPSDSFAEADRLAAKGDRIGAIRALCAGVAATLAGERSWEGSSLTVREIFQRAPDHDELRALLLPFEAAVYGGRDVDAATYLKAAQVAARFRPQPARAAA